jgi:PAS domain S-box-containing protein
MEIKFKEQLPIALEQATAHLRQAQQTLMRFGKIVAEKTGARRPTPEDLQRLMESSRVAIRAARERIARMRSQLSLASGKAAVHLQKSQKVVTAMAKDAAVKLQEAHRASGTDLRKLQASSREAMVVANAKLGKLGSQISVASEKAAVHLQRSQQVVAGMAKEAGGKLQVASRARQDDLRKLQASSRDAIEIANGKLAKLASQLYGALRQTIVPFQRAQSALASAGKSVIERPRRLREARRTRETDLQRLLTNSADAIVVTNDKRRFVDANPKALDLFGVSDSNMRNFTIDTFLSHCQILERRRKWFAIRRDEKYGRCRIRRLDGSVRVAEYILVANAIPGQHLYRFLNVAAARITPLKSTAKRPARPTDDTRKPPDRTWKSDKAS